MTENTTNFPSPPPAEEPAKVEPALLLPPTESSHFQKRFLAVYAVLGLVLVGAGVGVVMLAMRPEPKPAPAWSSWTPTPDTVAKMSSQIADHVAHSYRVAKGGTQLTNVVPSKPTVTSGTTNIAITAIAIRKKANSNEGIEVLTGNDVTGSQMFTFCGLGDHCAITGGKATTIRGQLVRREALEVALYTFKFVPSIKSVIAFMPPAPGETDSPLLLLRRAELEDALDKPLHMTLPLAKPPLPTDSNPGESQTIDDLTLPNIFSYSLQALPTGGAAVVLDPPT